MPVKSLFRILEDPKDIRDEDLSKRVKELPGVITLFYFVGAGFMAFGALEALFKSSYDILVHGIGDKLFIGLLIIIGIRSAEIAYEELNRRAPGSVEQGKTGLSPRIRTILRCVIAISFLLFLVKYVFQGLNG